MRSSGTKLAIVGHSAGGGVTQHLLNKFGAEFREKVKVLAFTDGCLSSSSIGMENKAYFRRVSKARV